MSLPLRKFLPTLLTVIALLILVATTLYVATSSPMPVSAPKAVSQTLAFEPYGTDKEGPEVQEAQEVRVADLSASTDQVPDADKSAIDLLRAQLQELRTGATPSGKRTTLKPAIFRVVTNFSKADVRINGLDYKEFYSDDEQEGMVLPAGGPYTVVTDYNGKIKTSTMSFRPYETRFLIVELTGYDAPSAAAPAKPTPAVAPPREDENAEEKSEGDDSKSPGKITVYSKPRGTVIIDGKDTGTAAPNTIDAEDGRHEVQVKYEDGVVSEKKIVRVRKGSKIKLFFRQTTDAK